MKIISYLKRKFIMWFLNEIPELITQPKVIKMTQTIRPLSIDRLQYLHERKVVLSPVINTLKRYAYTAKGDISNNQVTSALAEAQTEMILIETEIQVLEEHFNKQKQPLQSTVVPLPQ